MGGEHRTVLIVEDDPNAADALEEAFERCSEEYSFSVMKCKDVNEYVSERLSEKQFDASVVDLALQRTNTMLGIQVLRDRRVADPSGILLVWSQHPNTINVVEAIRSGAVEFLPKTEHLAQNVVARTVALLRSRDASHQRRLAIDEVARGLTDEQLAKYDGRYVAVVDGEIVTDGPSRIECALEYQELAEEQTRWPRVPEIVQVRRTLWD